MYICCSGFRLDASEFETLAEKNEGVFWRAVSEEPFVKTEKSIFLAIDIDDAFIGTDARLIQVTVKPEACSVQAEGACKIQWLLREPTPGKMRGLLRV